MRQLLSRANKARSGHVPQPKQVRFQMQASGKPAFMIERMHVDNATALKLAADLRGMDLPLHSAGEGKPELKADRRFMTNCLAFGSLIFVSADSQARPEVKTYISHVCRLESITGIYVVQQLAMDLLLEFLVDETANRAEVKEQTEIQQKLSDILLDLSQKQASDLHITMLNDKATLYARILGKLYVYREWPRQQAQALINAIHYIAAGKSATLSELKSGEGFIGPDRFPLPKGMRGIRLEFAPMGFNGFDCILRFIGTSAGGDDRDLGFDKQHQEQLDRLRRIQSGLVVVTGPTGSGKSRTMRVEFIEKRFEATGGREKIITVESPIETEIPCAFQRSVVYDADENKRVANNTNSIRSALRSDPDVIVIGECMERTAAAITWEASDTGNPVITTAHTNDAVGVPFRFLDLEIPLSKVSDINLLRGIVAQRLVQVLCSCKLCLNDNPEHVDEAMYRTIQPFVEAGHKIYTTNPKGCSKCDGRGAIGRTAVIEIIIPDIEFMDAVRRQDREGARAAWLKHDGAKTMMEHALQKMCAGIVDPVEITSALEDISFDEDRLKALGLLGGRE